MSFSIHSFEIFSVFKVKLNFFSQYFKNSNPRKKNAIIVHNVGSFAGEEYIGKNSNQVS